MTKKRIIYIDEDARYGGPQHRMVLVANQLKQDFEFLFLISSDENKLFKRRLIQDSLNYKEIKITRLSKHKKTLIKYIIFFIPELISLILNLKKLNADIVQVNSTPHFKALLASAILRIPTIWVLEDSNLPFLVKIVFKLLFLMFKPNIIVTSQVVKKYYLKNQKFKKNIRKIYAPVSIKEFNYKKFKNKKIKTNSIKILMIANLTKIKGIEIFLDIVKKSPKNLKFVLCGGFTNTNKNYVKSLIKKFKLFKKKLNYVGHVNYIPKVISKCDILLCTSWSEAGPMTSIEGMFMKKPLISNKVGVIPELFKNKKNTLIVQKNEAKYFVKNIKLLISNNRLKNKIIEDAYKVVTKHFSIETISKKYKNYYKYIIKNKQNENL